MDVIYSEYGVVMASCNRSLYDDATHKEHLSKLQIPVAMDLESTCAFNFDINSLVLPFVLHMLQFFTCYGFDHKSIISC